MGHKNAPPCKETVILFQLSTTRGAYQLERAFFIILSTQKFGGLVIFFHINRLEDGHACFLFCSHL
nr:hypothetical protein [Brevibacillus laterosporus]